MMEGLDDSFDAAFFVSDHGSANSTSSVLYHTYNPRAIAEVRLNGAIAGEAGVNALVSLAHGVPVVLISGDRVTTDEAQPFCPDVEAVVVKESVSHNAALSLHPDVARELIRDGARRALDRATDFRLPSITLPVEPTVRFHNRALAELACALRGVERRDEKAVAMRDDDPLQLFRTFIAAVMLSRGVSE
jgi:D-amino peptidase